MLFRSAVVVGATRLADGRILVGDRGSVNLKLFAADGKYLRSFARKGKGPGEIQYLKALLRCGDSVFTLDIDGDRTSVFSLEGKYVRVFRFGSPQGGPPYRSARNRNRVFVHFGWEVRKQMTAGAYRGPVPFWISGADSAVRRVFGDFPGSERLGQVVDGVMRGSRPLPLGKQPDVAIGADRVYIGTADRYEIGIYEFSGKEIGTIRKADVDLKTTRADIDNEMAKEIASCGDACKDRIERHYATIPFPRTVPAYVSLRVDFDGNLWVQEFPRARSATVTWTVFTPQGRQLAGVSLPTHLEVYEIGPDYVLGRFLDPSESIPEVRLYRLRRGLP